MSFVATVPEAEATGGVAAMYQAGRGADGLLPNHVKAFSLRPEFHAGWLALIRPIRARMDPRRYELATLGAAKALRSSYCMLAHGSVLLGTGVSAETVEVIARDHHAAGLTVLDVAIMDYAAMIARSASKVGAGQIETLRKLGLTDAEICDIAATAAARCFFSKFLDALGTEPDAAFSSLPEPLRDALTVGRAIEAP